ncbi:cytochrome P450 [Saccharata proteae CBS 121410]|uniref:Bifunctional cytochrome P450/NADPH--P450 reductase n=1 Tax=Saccharata proteae CBS 121410 TaxID=1314787 RepID=A0A6A5YBD4_9PEZI|nr:cytochrome P450 [Saccharata proteae CBS 121410]
MSCPVKHDGVKAPVEPKANQDIIPIPQPPTRPFLGNITDIDPSFPTRSFWKLAETYGPIVKLEIQGNRMIICSSHELINEVCGSDRFIKKIGGVLEEVRALTGDGLFTAYQDEPNWAKAHRILMPVFGPMRIRSMFAGMMEIASQMILRWDRLGPHNEINTADDFTRLAFDTIGLCAFGYRFNEFYTDNCHPFVNQMGDVLVECGKRATRPSIENQLRMWSAARTQEDIAAMHKLCDEMIEERKQNPQPESQDILNAMLNQIDPETGEKLSEENIRFQMVTFLVAGHETTSGTLAFLFYNILKNPETLHKAQKEVDTVVGDQPLDIKHLSKLPYLEACIRETLRFLGPIGIIALNSEQPTTLAGKYKIEPTDQILCNLRSLHHDPAVYGEDADQFKPERFLDGGFERLPPNAWKPFGRGVRACIGRAFAEQEMMINFALILQRFQVEMADPSYDLHLKSTLTIKPDEFHIKVRRRPNKDIYVGIMPEADKQQKAMANGKRASIIDGPDMAPKPITVLYGSNAGTCKAFAEDIQTNASRYGFAADVQTMDHATEHIPTDQPVIIITPSYEGKPPDNAKKFVTWLESVAGEQKMKGVNYTVFGVGNSEWASTFHRIPKLVDELMNKMGGKSILPAGFANAKEDIVGPWEEWLDKLWNKLRENNGVSKRVENVKMEVVVESPSFVSTLVGQQITLATVKENRILAGTEVGPAKRHMEVELPGDTSYKSGDYLVVLPLNPPAAVHRIVRLFNLAPDDTVKISKTNKAYLVSLPFSLQTGNVSVFELLATRVELNTPASQKQIEAIIQTAPEDKRKSMEKMASDEYYRSEILAKRVSIIDFLEDNPSCNLSFGAYLDMLKPLTPRQYSISSSPLLPTISASGEPTTVASVTYDVHSAPALSNPSRTFDGVASTYMARLEPGSRIRCYVRSTNAAFHLPKNAETPIIMMAAGTGIAPMRGFIQERACIAQGGARKVGPALLFFGCRDHEKDFIYADELKKWEDDGVVAVRPAFSKTGPKGGDGFKYVHDRIWAEREELSQMFLQGAKIFVCGSAAKLGKSASEVCKKIWLEKHPGKTEEDAEKWLEEQREERYVSDVFE